MYKHDVIVSTVFAGVKDAVFFPEISKKFALRP